MVGKRIIWMALSLVLLGTGVASAWQSGRIEGRVTRQDGTPVPGVAVRIEATGQSVLTGSDGRYRLQVPAGTYEVSFTLVENSLTEQVEVPAGGTVEVSPQVDWNVAFAETITVTSVSRRAERITDAPAAVTVVSQQEIEREAATGQVPKLLEFTPGVDFTQSGLYDFNFNTRGFNSSLNRRILTLVDGRDPAVPFLGAQEWAAVSFPMDELATVELVRGPGSALYGANAFNGVLNMTTKSPRGTEGGSLRLTGGELSTRRADFRWATEVGGGWYTRLVGGYQEGDDFNQSRNTSVEYSRFCTTPGQVDCLRREAVPLAEDDVQIAYGGLRFDKHFENENVFTIEGGTAALEGPTFLTGIGRVQVTDVERPWARVNYNARNWNVLSYYDQRIAENQVALASGAGLWEDSSNFHVEVQGNVGFARDKGFLVGGVAYHQQEVDTSNDQGFHTLMAEAKSEDQQAVFGQVEYAFTSNLKAVVAARVDESSLHDTQFSPKASLVWSVTPHNTLRFTYNEAFQVPNYSEFFLRVPAATPITAFAPLEDALAPFLGGQTLGLRSIPVLALGNETLDVEEITSYEVGYSGIFANKLFLTVDYYQSEIENFVTDLLPGVNNSLTPYAPPSFLPAPIAAQILGTLRGGLGAANFAGLTDIGGRPALVLSYTNAGIVDTEGIDVAFNWYVNNNWTLDASYSWFDFEVKEQVLGDQLLPNAPENKYNLGATYSHGRFGTSVKYRWVEGFRWATGVFVGDVPSYDVVDLSARFDATERITVGLDVSHATDDEHYQIFGGDLLRRRALGYVAFSW